MRLKQFSVVFQLYITMCDRLNELYHNDLTDLGLRLSDPTRALLHWTRKIVQDHHFLSSINIYHIVRMCDFFIAK